jgi:hypothetical protein
LETEVYIDYSPHHIAAMQTLKKMQDAMLEKRYADAKEAALVGIVELKLALNAIKHEEEKASD